jgi:transcriptional regulator with XRE-family HTH domain
MRLLDYMKQRGLSDETFAALHGDATPRAVKKWKYGETTPRLPDLLRIEDVTGGAVTARDFLPEPSATEERAA